MKIINRVIVLIITSTFASMSALSQDNNCIGNAYKANVWSFYKQVIESDSISKISAPFTPHVIHDRSLITYNLGKEELKQVIENAEIIDEGDEMVLLVKLIFPNDREIYVEVSKEDDCDINTIWLADGSNMEAREILLTRPGTPNRANMEIYIEPNSKSSVVHFLHEGDLFFYTPNSFSDWYKVYNHENDIIPIGYIRKDSIRSYKDFSKELKERVKKLRKLTC